MKTSFALPVVLLAMTGLSQVAVAGPEPISGKEMKQTMVQPQECYYRDNEFNISLWGTYVFTDTGYDRPDIEEVDDLDIHGTYDRFVGDDTWGGGIDAKYFFKRYFGVGIEGFALAGDSQHAILDHGTRANFEEFYEGDDHLIGAVLGTFTFRFPIGCSRFAPYAWAGGGAIFGGRNDRAVGHDPFFLTTSDHFENEDESRAIGQFGGGIEVRVTRHIGITGDFSWNVVDGTHNNFGMVRSGLNFAF
jgi:hypothetical protein